MTFEFEFDLPQSVSNDKNQEKEPVETRLSREFLLELRAKSVPSDLTLNSKLAQSDVDLILK